MAFASISTWLETAASNLELDGISLAENVMRPPAVNNAFRELMAQVAEWTGDDTIASAGTTDISSVPAQYVTVTGTTTITSLGTIKAGWIKFVKFTGALTLTHNATSLILPGAANILTAANDTAIFVSLGSGNWQCWDYVPAARLLNTVNGQYKFPATANLSSDPNTLDDYEEGTYSPPITASSGTVTSTSGAAGVYQKIGKYVYFKASVTITNAGTGAGFLRIGLPFTADADFAAFGRETFTTGAQLQGEITASTNYVAVASYNNGWPGGTGNRIIIQGFYTTAS